VREKGERGDACGQIKGKRQDVRGFLVRASKGRKSTKNQRNVTYTKALKGGNTGCEVAHKKKEQKK